MTWHCRDPESTEARGKIASPMNNLEEGLLVRCTDVYRRERPLDELPERKIATLAKAMEWAARNGGTVYVATDGGADGNSKVSEERVGAWSVAVANHGPTSHNDDKPVIDTVVSGVVGGHDVRSRAAEHVALNMAVASAA